LQLAPALVFGEQEAKMFGFAMAKSLLSALALAGAALINSEPCSLPRDPEALVETIVKQAPILDLSKPVSELQQVLLVGRLSCVRVYLIDQHEWGAFADKSICSIGKKLVEFLQRQIERNGIDLIPYLEGNDFNCVTHAKQIICNNIFSFVEPRPRDWLTGKPINPDVNVAILTEVCIEKARNVRIKAIGTIFEKEIRDSSGGQ
jgi:hypothetical protein